MFNSVKVFLHMLLCGELLGALGTSIWPFFLVDKSDMSSQVSFFWKSPTTDLTMAHSAEYSRICDSTMADFLRVGLRVAKACIVYRIAGKLREWLPHCCSRVCDRISGWVGTDIVMEGFPRLWTAEACIMCVVARKFWKRLSSCCRFRICTCALKLL